jgi:hypothetical protein
MKSYEAVLNNEDIITQVHPLAQIIFALWSIQTQSYIVSLVDVRLFYGLFSCFFKNLSKDSYYTALFLALQCLLEVELLSLYQL